MYQRIKELRKELKLSQQEFADRLGIARGNISAYEVNKNAPSDAVISLICKEFSVNEEWLRYGNNEMFIHKDANEKISEFLADIQLGDTDSFKHKFISAISNLTDKQWKAIEEFAKSMFEDNE